MNNNSGGNAMAGKLLTGGSGTCRFSCEIDWYSLKSISCVFTAAFTCMFQIKAALGRFIIAVFQTVT